MNLEYINVNIQLLRPFANCINKVLNNKLAKSIWCSLLCVKILSAYWFLKFSPYSSTSAHTRAERLNGVESRKEIVVVVTIVFWFSVHIVGEVVFIDTVPLCSVAHFRPVTLETGWSETILILDFLNFQNLMKYILCNIVIYRATRWDRLIHFVISNFLSRFHKVWRFVSCERCVNIWRWHHIILIKMLCEAL